MGVRAALPSRVCGGHWGKWGQSEDLGRGKQLEQGTPRDQCPQTPCSTQMPRDRPSLQSWAPETRLEQNKEQVRKVKDGGLPGGASP